MVKYLLHIFFESFFIIKDVHPKVNALRGKRLEAMESASKRNPTHLSFAGCIDFHLCPGLEASKLFYYDFIDLAGLFDISVFIFDKIVCVLAARC